MCSLNDQDFREADVTGQQRLFAHSVKGGVHELLVEAPATVSEAIDDLRQYRLSPCASLHYLIKQVIKIRRGIGYFGLVFWRFGVHEPVTPMLPTCTWALNLNASATLLRLQGS